MHITDNITFKSTYPVAHWITEANKEYALVSNIQLVKKLQGKLIRVLNKSLIKNPKDFNSFEQTIRAYFGSVDADYRCVPCVRSFYNRGINSPDKFIPTSYIISGKDVTEFEKRFAKNIGKAKAQAKYIQNKFYSEDALRAIQIYNLKGLEFVQDNAKQIKDQSGISYILHTKFEIIRNKLGKIKDYKLLDVRFLPSMGAKNPLERLK